ncbi:MAG: amidohydrolase family protein [Deltaproteobacteria bacterium]|nr:amidohydrolase family protein [Deltaproteobacteria bacterium]
MDTEKSIYILSGSFIDGTGGPILPGGVLEIREGIIVSLSRVESCDLNDHNVIDLTRCTILPGLVDCHVHLAMSGTGDREFRRKQLIAPFEEIKPLISRHVDNHLRSGVIALRDGGDHQGWALRYKKECISQGVIPGVLKTAGRAWHSRGRYGKLIGRTPFEGQDLSGSIQSDHEGIDHIKIINSGLNSLTEYGKETAPQFEQKDLEKAVITGRRLGLKTMVHANGREAVKSSVEAGCDSIEHGFFMDDENLRLMAEKETAWVPTMITMKAYSMLPGMEKMASEVAERNLEHQMEQVARAMEYGVTIAAGTDSGSPGVHHGLSLAGEIKLLVSAGLSIENAIKCASSNGARLLGLEDRIGTLRPGMPATFIAVKGGPDNLIDLLGFPEAVWVNGKSLEINRG